MSLARFCAPLAGLALLAAPCAIAAAADETQVTVVTHLDLLRTNLAAGLPIIEQFVLASRSDPGVISFQLITWAPTPNHFQLLEVYDSLEAFNRHVSAAHTIAFRTAVEPYIGAPIDERLYTRDADEH
jgi:quinol monooxygenase YgiN